MRAVLPWLLLTACSTSIAPVVTVPRPDATTMVAAPDPEAAFAPTPYTAEQIRAASPEGRTLVFVVEQPGKQPVRQRMRFLAVDDERATISTEILGEDDKVLGEPITKVETWDTLRKHAQFARAETSIDEATVETPAGSFACRRYTVRETGEAGEFKRVLSFAIELAGPPVEITVERDGELISSMTLLSNGAL